MKLKTFTPGGIHPAENKLSEGSVIQKLKIPQQVTIPVSQHLGAPATPLVKKNDQVKVGQPIASKNGFISTNVHSSVSGKVLAVEDLVDSSGYRKQSVTIEVEGDDWADGIDNSDELVKEITASREEIIQKMEEHGIVGLGGATFPSHVKVNLPEGKKAEVLLLNGVECEPYLTADHQLMLEKPVEILIGIKLLMKAIGVERAIIGIENNKPDAIALLGKHCTSSEFQQIDVVPLKVQYPQGGEKQLIKAILNREVPPGGLPIEVGAVVHNVGTAFAVYESIQKNKPLIERVVTITGKDVINPGNYLVRIGTSVNEIIEAAGGLPESTAKVVNGGPMMGKALTQTDVPIVKGTSGILIINEKEAPRKEEKNCIRCGRCVQDCSLKLQPYLLANLTKKRMWQEVENSFALDCCECGTCSYSCPANIPLLDYIRLGKTTVNKIIRSRKG